jgi:hypothetical protein
MASSARWLTTASRSSCSSCAISEPPRSGPGSRPGPDQALPQRIPVPSRTGWTLLAPGARSTCATRTGHALFCWGLSRRAWPR